MNTFGAPTLPGTASNGVLVYSNIASLAFRPSSIANKNAWNSGFAPLEQDQIWPCPADKLREDSRRTVVQKNIGSSEPNLVHPLVDHIAKAAKRAELMVKQLKSASNRHKRKNSDDNNKTSKKASHDPGNRGSQPPRDKGKGKEKPTSQSSKSTYRGPQPEDECQSCGKKGYWASSFECPKYDIWKKNNPEKAQLREAQRGFETAKRIMAAKRSQSDSQERFMVTTNLSQTSTGAEGTLEGLADTRANNSFINENKAERLGLRPSAFCNLSFGVFGKQSFQVTNAYNPTLNIKDSRGEMKSFDLRLYGVRKAGYKLVLGMDWFRMKGTGLYNWPTIRWAYARQWDNIEMLGPLEFTNYLMDNPEVESHTLSNEVLESVVDIIVIVAFEARDELNHVLLEGYVQISSDAAQIQVEYLGAFDRKELRVLVTPIIDDEPELDVLYKAFD
ncbi:hypothetical protein G7Y89_g11131 [Cudoniella acicularis]|uniref:Uncharacterized protein n=1 Tax=Cudoniella acicularis TaxID=354080 RepID=A0A8H4RE36_9HELO|nr:hypothetical protein G7Y89_g11131 [Cudoniella acicularis]